MFDRQINLGRKAWSRQLFLTDRSGVDDGLHATCDPRMAEDKHELIGPIACQLSCVEVFEDVDAILGDEDLVHLEDAHTWPERDRLEAPAVGAYRNHLLTRQILRTLLAKAWLAGDIALLVLAHER